MSGAKTESDTSAVAKETTNGNKVDLGLLEEDDEFEEFPAEDEGATGGQAQEETEQARVWEDNWDDDTVEDDFSNQLRAELESQTRMQH
jgi:26 proteasome complex subunit DSS1